MSDTVARTECPAYQAVASAERRQKVQLGFSVPGDEQQGGHDSKIINSPIDFSQARHGRP